MPAPSVSLLEDAANATFWGPITTAFNLAQIDGANGAPMQIATANGCTAAAFSDGHGNIVVSFQGTQTTQQQLADVELMSGQKGATIPAFQDAVAFVRSVEQTAAAMGISASNIYITGHSLGGTLAEYAASQTGMGGASFAGSGVPGYQAPSAPASNFVSYVEHGDAFANWATDGSERTIIGAGAHQDHYGQLVLLGSPSQDALTNTIIADDRALLPALFTGHLPQALAKLGNDFTDNLLTIHGMNVYGANIATLPAPNFATLAARVASDPAAMLANFTSPSVVTAAPTASPSVSAASALQHLESMLGSTLSTLQIAKT